MTVAELIQKLQMFPRDALVVTQEGHRGFQLMSGVITEFSLMHVQWVGKEFLHSDNPKNPLAVCL